MKGSGVLAIVAGFHVDVIDAVEAEGAVAGVLDGLGLPLGFEVDMGVDPIPGARSGLDVGVWPMAKLWKGQGPLGIDAPVAVDEEDGQNNKADQKKSVELAEGPPSCQGRSQGVKPPVFRHGGC